MYPKSLRHHAKRVTNYKSGRKATWLTHQVRRGFNSQMNNLVTSSLEDSPGSMMNARPSGHVTGSSMSRRNKPKFSSNFVSSEIPIST